MENQKSKIVQFYSCYGEKDPNKPCTPEKILGELLDMGKLNFVLDWMTEPVPGGEAGKLS